jgi:hypothetical protein
MRRWTSPASEPRSHGRNGMAEVDVRFAEILDAAHAGEVERAKDLLAPLLAEEPRWAIYVRVLGARGYLPHADELV